MASFSQDNLFDAIRGRYVAATPEERVRQRLVQRMTLELGFPKELLVIEKELRSLPHLTLSPQALPDRRADLLCFAKEIHPQYPLYPLLLVECKEGEIKEEAIEQLLGYNHYVQAYFVAVVGAEQVRLGYYDGSKKGYQFVSHLPAYRELLAAARRASSGK